MKSGFLYSIVIGVLVLALAFISGCTPKAATPPPVDVAGTIAVQLVSSMLTQTVAAYSPTPIPVTPSITPTIFVTPTETVYVATKRPQVIGDGSSCWNDGPGPTYGYKNLSSHISDAKKVDILGVGSVPGWFIIRNPYNNGMCWISATELEIYSDIDVSVYPVMTPGRR